jgi:hypothetical protein
MNPISADSPTSTTSPLSSVPQSFHVVPIIPLNVHNLSQIVADALDDAEVDIFVDFHEQETVNITSGLAEIGLDDDVEPLANANDEQEPCNHHSLAHGALLDDYPRPLENMVWFSTFNPT